MNTWVIVGILFGLFVIGGIAAVNALSPSEDTEKPITSCASCGGKCSAGNNCGLATCGATQGGTCGCGK